MAHRKAGGSAKNLTDSNPKFLGVKLSDGQTAKAGSIIIRQRGTPTVAGKNVGMGKDHTLYSLIDGIVRFGRIRKVLFNGKKAERKIVHVEETASA